MKFEMKDIYDTALKYFDGDTLVKFTKILVPWEKDLKSYFFQVAQSQSPNVPQLELGAHVGEAIIDITFIKGLTQSIIVVPCCAINLISFIEGVNFSDLTISSLSPSSPHQLSGIRYQAVLDKSREQLKEYATHLQNIIIEKKS